MFIGWTEAVKQLHLWPPPVTANSGMKLSLYCEKENQIQLWCVKMKRQLFKSRKRFILIWPEIVKVFLLSMRRCSAYSFLSRKIKAPFEFQHCHVFAPSKSNCSLTSVNRLLHVYLIRYVLCETVLHKYVSYHRPDDWTQKTQVREKQSTHNKHNWIASKQNKSGGQDQDDFMWWFSSLAAESHISWQTVRWAAKMNTSRFLYKLI